MSSHAAIHFIKEKAPSNFWNDQTNQRQYFDWLGDILGVDEVHQWYKVSQNDIWRHQGHSILGKFDNSPVRALSHVYPDTEWLTWRFANPPRHMWTLQQQKLFFEWLGDQLGIIDMNEWAHVPAADIARCGTSFVTDLYDGNLHLALFAVFPEVQWQLWKFGPEYATNVGVHRVFFDWLAETIGTETLDSWYQITAAMIESHGGQDILSCYGDSHARALCAVYADTTWQPWRFANVLHGVWEDTAVHREFFDYLAMELNVIHLDDWYGVSLADITRYGGGWVMAHYYQHSVITMLHNVYPHVQWQHWRFSTEAWKDEEQHRIFLDWVAEKLVLEEVDQWYTVGQEVHRLGGATLLGDYYDSSLPKALKCIYKDTTWHPWIFDRQENLWDDKKVQMEYVEWLRDQLHIDVPTDWTGVTKQVIIKYHGAGLLAKYGDLSQLYKNLFFLQESNSEGPRAISDNKVQHLLKTWTSVLFPDAEIEYNNKVTWLKYAETQRAMQMDVWIPKLNLGMEYQGVQHYEDNFMHNNMHEIAYTYHHDAEKLRLCDEMGINFIVVPYWCTDNDQLWLLIEKQCEGLGLLDNEMLEKATAYFA